MIFRKAVATAGEKYNDVKALDSTRFKNVHDVASFLKSIPGDSNASPWKQSETIAEAYKDKFVWTDSEGNKWFAEAHGADSSADAGPNASTGWVYRVSVKIKGEGKPFYLASDGKFYSWKMFKPNSPNYSSTVANATHIPINK